MIIDSRLRCDIQQIGFYLYGLVEFPSLFCHLPAVSAPVCELPSASDTSASFAFARRRDCRMILLGARNE